MRIPYEKGLALAWRFCILWSLFISVPWLFLITNSSPLPTVEGFGLAYLGVQLITNFLFSWIFSNIYLLHLFDIPCWFNRQKTYVKILLSMLLFFALTEFFFRLQLLTTDSRKNVFFFNEVNFGYNILVLLVIRVFGNFLEVDYRNYRINLENEQLKREKLKTQLDALRHQLNPHFLFNALNILNISIASNPDEAQRIVHDLSDILRYNLKIQNQNVVQLSDELDIAKSYLALHKARFGDKLMYTFDSAEPTKEWYIIPLSLQILIENAIKHNVITSNHVLQIEVKLDEANKQLLVTNSITKKTNVASSGIGLQNLDARYRLQTGKETSQIHDAQQFLVKVPLIESP
jgi:two-component system LytT family sensor kinase